jgi:hypothetical protein
MSILSYTTLNPFPCKESLNITPGKSCLTKKTLNKLNKLETEDIEPVVIDQELLPNDGSTHSNMIRRLAASLNCSSEYCILNSKEAKKVLTSEEITNEKDRFKVRGPRLTNVGTDGERHAYRVLLQWSEVFDFFYPLPHIILSDDKISKNKLDVKEIMRIVKDEYPQTRVIAADMSIQVNVTEKICGWHAVVLLIDMREKKWTVEFFDSSGSPPNDKINEVMEKLADKLRSFKDKLKLKGDVETVVVSGKLRHQHTSTECGPHSLIYIRRRLEGISYQFFSKFKIPDQFAKSFRRDIFVI